MKLIISEISFITEVLLEKSGVICFYNISELEINVIHVYKLTQSLCLIQIWDLSCVPWYMLLKVYFLVHFGVDQDSLKKIKSLQYEFVQVIQEYLVIKISFDIMICELTLSGKHDEVFRHF